MAISDISSILSFVLCILASNLVLFPPPTPLAPVIIRRQRRMQLLVGLASTSLIGLKFITISAPLFAVFVALYFGVSTDKDSSVIVSKKKSASLLLD